MTTLSKWKINGSTQKHLGSSVIEDVCYEVATTEGVRCNFKPVPKGLHTYEVSENTNGNIFGSLVADHFIDRSNDMCRVRIGDTK